MKTQRYLWLLDAGHAPDTRGKRSPVMGNGEQLLEWELARDVVRILRAVLEAKGIASHELTPRTNVDMPAYKRADLANEVADLCELPCALASLHANAQGRGGEWTDASGIATWHYPSPTSTAMAEVFQAHLVQAMGWRDRGTKPRKGLALLRRTSMPSVLTETGFYTHLPECFALRGADTRLRIAKAHADAIASIERNGL